MVFVRAWWTNLAGKPTKWSHKSSLYELSVRKFVIYVIRSSGSVVRFSRRKARAADNAGHTWGIRNSVVIPGQLKQPLRFMQIPRKLSSFGLGFTIWIISWIYGYIFSLVTCRPTWFYCTERTTWYLKCQSGRPRRCCAIVLKRTLNVLIHVTPCQVRLAVMQNDGGSYEKLRL